MSDFVKGEKPRDLDAAKGGPTLERVRDFTKDQSVMLGKENPQDYTKDGAAGKYAKPTGDKTASMPKKS